MLEYSAVSAERMKKKRKREEKRNGEVVTVALVRAIASFLKANGFTKTLSALRSEAQIENDDGCEPPSLDLKDMARKCLELSYSDGAAVETTENKCGKVQVPQLSDSEKEKEEHVQDQKKNKKRKKSDQIIEPVGNHEEQMLVDERSEDKKKSEKKKKKRDKSVSNDVDDKAAHSNSQGEDDKIGSEVTVSLIEEDKKSKKKRKQKPIDVQDGINTESGKKEKDINLSSKCGAVESDPEIKIDPPSVGLPKTEKVERIDVNHVKNESENNGSSKSGKSEKKNSTTQKAANAFQRVKVDAVEFVDERLQDNSYWAKDGAESGYGAKAQEVLGQVRGRDFRHEKTKKKRGSYRGGQIDFQTHSVKFQYSDEDE